MRRVQWQLAKLRNQPPAACAMFGILNFWGRASRLGTGIVIASTTFDTAYGHHSVPLRENDCAT